MTEQEKILDELSRLNPNAPLPVGIYKESLDKCIFNHLSHIDVKLSTIFIILGVQTALVLATFGAVIGAMIMK